MQPLARKLLVATVSGTVAALAAWFALEQRTDQTVELIDNTEDMAEILRERSLEAPAPSAEPGAPEAVGEVAGAAIPSVSADAPPATPQPDYPPALVREPLELETAKRFFAALRKRGQYVWQPRAHLWARASGRFRRTFAEHPDGGWDIRTNAMGFRKQVEVRDPAPDVRVLVTGDSHTAGLVPNGESYSNVLEELLAAAEPNRGFEVLNGGIGGTSMYQYLGVLEYLRDQLQPQVLVVGFYGGNDFLGVMRLYRYFTRRPAPAFGPFGGARLSEQGAVGEVSQLLAQTAYFLDNPGDLVLAREVVDSLTVEISDQCRAAGIRPVFLYIPPANAAQPDLYRDQFDQPLQALGIERAALLQTDELGRQWLAFLAERGFDHVDMGPVFRASPEPCYWFSDLHINTHGHRLVAEALVPFVAETGR